MEQASEVSGETGSTTVVVSRMVPYPVKTVWDVLMTNEGAETLLGPGAQLGSKGSTWQSHDGRQGVIRSFHPMEEIRFSWRINDSGAPSMVALNLVPVGDEATELKIEHAKLSPTADRDWLQERWTAALDRIESSCL